MNRRGFTIVELLIASVLMAIVGVIMTRILISDSRFVARQDAMLNARQASRAALNTMSVELRMISDGGLVAATPLSITVQVPYAFGMTCRNPSGTSIIASLMPPDSLMYATAVPGGIAWPGPSGRYENFVAGVSVASSSNLALCTADSIRVVPSGKLVIVSGIPAGNRPPSGTLFYLYQTVTYRFAASVMLPGRVGLWRQAGGSSAEELVTPFTSGAKFAFLTGPNLQINANPPAVLDSVRGLELHLIGASDRTPLGSAQPPSFALRTKIAFLNRTM